MDEEVFYDGGIDIDSSFTFNDGDIVLSKYSDNLCQAITNRLNTDLDELELFYEDYGSVLSGFFGWKTNDETLGFIESELNIVLSKEPRIESFTSNLSYTDEGVLKIELTITPIGAGENIDVNLLLNNTTGELEIIEEEA